jgi:hypothetical protein
VGLFDKFKGWLGFSEEEKVQLDRRAFLKGMAVTSAGVLIPGAAVFDMARAAPGGLPVNGVIQAQAADAMATGLVVYKNGIVQREGSDYTVDDVGSSFQIHPNSGLILPGDQISIDYTAKLDDDKKIRIYSEVPTGTYAPEKNFMVQFFSGG